MTSLSKVSLLAFVASLLVGASSAQAQPVADSPEPASCPLEDATATPLATKTPMCNYLAKCCEGGNGKCCENYFKNCGD